MSGATCQFGQACTDPNCDSNHSVALCEVCNLNFVSQQTYQKHLRSQRHKRNDAGQIVMLVRCPLCDTHMSSGPSWLAHLGGSGHRAKAQRLGVDPDVQPEQTAESAARLQLCVACNFHVSKKGLERHNQTKQHILKLQFSQYQTILDEAEQDKHGVILSGKFDFDVVEPATARAGVTASGSIRTNLPSSQIKLVRFGLASLYGGTNSSSFILDVKGTNRVLILENSIEFTISARQGQIGRSEDRADFVFEDVLLKKWFMISRSLRIISGSKEDHELLRPIAPYKAPQPTRRQPETDVVSGIPPPALDAIPYVSRLPYFFIPDTIIDTLSKGPLSAIMRRVEKVHLPSVFNSNTYARHFNCLLWAEEFRMEKDLEFYDIERGQFNPHPPYYYLDVPGLAEKRPSILVGDSILAQRPNALSGHWFEGRVHVVRKEEVGLRFDQLFRGYGPFRIRFKLNRHPMRRQHLGMDTGLTQDRILFPRADHVLGASNPTLPLRFYNPLIGTNPAQIRAITSIVYQQPGSVPFLVFGPPGTGKTVTIVEAILQLLRRKPTSRILACAPSNSAADLIASRLVSLGPNALFRLYAPSRAKEQVPTELKDFVFQNRDGHFSIPPMKKMQAFKVVVTTCVSAAIIAGVGIPRGHYSHIFVDEAGQATEPEVMIAIKTMADRATNIVLSGDPKQLGPVVRSSVARAFGLEKSYMERLIEREIYDEHQGTSVVKLVKNFRSHNAILKFPSERFYKGDLQCCGDPNIVNTYIKSSHVERNFPIVFYGVVGKDDREASNPSFFNIDEVTQVKNVIEALRFDRKIRISDNDIGVITPYHAQCLKIRTRLRNFADGVKVGSVEEFQGQERKVIIISTVRSSTEFIEYDLRHTLGFVASPRRFNVAVTRAQALLVIIGNPSVLSLDPLWRSFMNYIFHSGGWRGTYPTWDTNESVNEAGGYDKVFRDTAEKNMNELTKIMEALTMAGIEDDANIERPWNDME